MTKENEITIGEDKYQLKYFPALEGLGIRNEFIRTIQNGEVSPDPSFVFRVISKGATVNSLQIDQKKFDAHFRGKYGVIDELFMEVLDYNFDIKGVIEGNQEDATAE